MSISEIYTASEYVGLLYSMFSVLYLVLSYNVRDPCFEITLLGTSSLTLMGWLFKEKENHNNKEIEKWMTVRVFENDLFCILGNV